MDLLENPFHILGATPRDTRQRIIELADERSLLIDADACTQARSDLTNPRKRQAAEIAWLIGVGPKRAEELITRIQESPLDLLDEKNIPPIARSNLLSTAMKRLPADSPFEVSKWILEMARAFEEVKIEQVQATINDDRIVSGFSEITDISGIQSELSELRRSYLKTIRDTLDKLDSAHLVQAVTIAIEAATENGETHGQILIDDLVDTYEVEAQEFLRKEGENINQLVDEISDLADKEASDDLLAKKVFQLNKVVRNWDTVAQPIQVSAKSRGLEHDASHEVAAIVRGLAIDLYNEHGELELSQKITEMLSEVFAEVVEVAERTAEDIAALENIAEQRSNWVKQASAREEQWRNEITYKAELGIVFKDELSISPEGVKIKSSHFDLDEITATRWGATRHTVNGIPSGTTYKITVGSRKGYETLDFKNGNVFEQFIERLWKAVGVRLFTENLITLKDGQKIRFGSVTLSDFGAELTKSHLFAADEKVFCRWSELVIGNGPGTFYVAKRDEKKVSESFSYQDEDNIHILEAMMRAFWKRGGSRLSKLLET
jgi:hypothetical protein